MLAHILTNTVLADPLESSLKEVLARSCSLNISAPLLDVRVPAIRELFFASRDKGT